jgi:hypothetical protein
MIGVLDGDQLAVRDQSSDDLCGLLVLEPIRNCRVIANEMLDQLLVQLALSGQQVQARVDLACCPPGLAGDALTIFLPAKAGVSRDGSAPAPT